MSKNELHSVPEESIQLSISRLQLSFHRLYELGRASVKPRFLSFPEAIAGAFFAELVSAVVFLFTSKPGTLFVNGRPDDSLTAHIVLTLAFAVTSVIAHACKARSARMSKAETDARDRAASDEVEFLVRGVRSRDIYSSRFEAQYQYYDDPDYECDDFDA